jgi:hypothetical protein
LCPASGRVPDCLSGPLVVPEVIYNNGPNSSACQYGFDKKGMNVIFFIGFTWIVFSVAARSNKAAIVDGVPEGLR